MKDQLIRKIIPSFLSLSLVATMSCTGIRLKTKDIKVVFSDEGVITEIRMANGKLIKPVCLSTDLLGCIVEGKIISRKNRDGSVEFEKILRNDSLKSSCVLTERFIPAQNSIRCELTIKGNGEPWSTLIETKLKYPILNGQTKMWATWGAPQYDSSKVGDRLHHILRRIEPAAKAEVAYWIDPLVPVPFTNATYFYGAPYFEYDNMHLFFCPFQENLISIPVVSILDDTNNSGLTIALSPEDNIIDLTMKTTEDGTITLSRLFNRISKNNVVELSFDIISQESDWRCGLGWMKNRYPEFFNPVNPLALQMGGTSAYSSYSVESLNFDIEKMKKMAFKVNWQASFDFPYMGMFIPPVNRNDKWKRYGEGMITIAEMDNFAKRYRDKGFYVLNYFNVTEFGANVKFPPPSKKISKPDTELWKECNDLLYSRFLNSILPVPEKCIKDPKYKNSASPVPYFTWGGAVVTDCADSVYSEFLLEQARRHVTEIPNSFGICIDRLDWVRLFNERADDGITWLYGKPARSLLTSWKNISYKLSSILHPANKVIFVNNHSKRIDMLQYVDGIFDEFTYAGSPLNLTAFLCINKPALGWTYGADAVRLEGGDSFFQKYLYMGVFPMCPFPNNDHSITPSQDVDKYYLDYGPLMKLMEGRKWVLQPHVVTAKEGLAKVNIFKIKGGYSVPVMYGEKSEVEIVLRDLDGIKEGFTCKAYYPGQENPVVLKYKINGNIITLDVPLVRGCAMLYLENKSGI